MTKERFKQFYDSVWKKDKDLDSLKLTDEEIKSGYHFCYDWDGLFVGPNSPEFEVCTCYSEKEKIRIRKK